MTRGDFLHIVEIRTKIVSVSSFLIGTTYAATSGGDFSWPMALLMFAAVLCVDMGTTGFNSYYDFLHGVDTPATALDGDKVLLRGDIRPSMALLISMACFLTAAVLGLAIASRVGWWIIGVGGLGMAVGYLYSGGPYPLSRTPLGELLAGGFLGGLLIVLSFMVQAGHLTTRALAMGLPSSLMIASILTVNNTCDIEGDRIGGRHTLSIRLGARRAAWVIYGLGAGAYLLAVGLAVAGVMPRLSVLPVTLAALVSGAEFLRMHRRGYSPATKAVSMGSISKIFLLFTAALLLGMALG